MGGGRTTGPKIMPILMYKWKDVIVGLIGEISKFQPAKLTKLFHDSTELLKLRNELKIVFVTGGAGFMSSRFAEELVSRGYYVILDDLYRGKLGEGLREAIEHLSLWEADPCHS